MMPHVRTRREDPFLLRDVFFEDVGLQRPAELRARHAVVFGGRDVLRERDARRTVDRHRRRDLAEVDAGEELFHVAQRVDRDAALADLTARLRRVRVVTHQRRHIERDREPVLALREQKMIALVGLLGVAKARELAHRPKPVAVHAGVDAARVRILARQREIAREVEIGNVIRTVERLAAARRRSSGRPRPSPARAGAICATPTCARSERALRRIPGSPGRRAPTDARST